MEYKYQFKTHEEKEELTIANKDKFLIEEQYHLDGNFLIFSDEPRKIETIIIYTNIPKEEFDTQMSYMIDLDFRLSMIELGL